MKNYELIRPYSPSLKLRLKWKLRELFEKRHKTDREAPFLSNIEPYHYTPTGEYTVIINQ